MERAGRSGTNLAQSVPRLFMIERTGLRAVRVSPGEALARVRELIASGQVTEEPDIVRLSLRATRRISDPDRAAALHQELVDALSMLAVMSGLGLEEKNLDMHVAARMRRDRRPDRVGLAAELMARGATAQAGRKEFNPRQLDTSLGPGTL